MATRKTSDRKPPTRTATKQGSPKTRRWSAKVTTDSTHPRKGLFLESPSTIARQLATKNVSPKGPVSGMRMLNFYINRAGKNLGKDRVSDLQRAKAILSNIIASHKKETKSHKGPKKISDRKPKTKKAV